MGIYTDTKCSPIYGKQHTVAREISQYCLPESDVMTVTVSEYLPKTSLKHHWYSPSALILTEYDVLNERLRREHTELP